MSLASLTSCSQTLVYYSSSKPPPSPPQHPPPPYSFLTHAHNSPLIPTTLIPVSTLKLSPCSPTLLTNGNWVPRRNRFLPANSADSDAQNESATGENGGNPSTSLLSFLCPLLKLFSVGLSYPFLFLSFSLYFLLITNVNCM